MKLRWKVIIGLVAVGILAALVLSRREGSEQRALEQTRRDLRAQGFKIGLAEFDFSTPDEFRARVTALTNASFDREVRNNAGAAQRILLQQVMPKIMQTIGRDSAVPFWKQEVWISDAPAYPRFGELPGDIWPVLREGLGEERELLDKACTAALAGPIRVPLNASQGHAILLPHLAAWKNLTQILSGRTALELHDGNVNAAWTNVLATTRLVTAWETKPVEVSYLVRVACCAMAFNITWQALQTNGWSDEQLSRLQREWESVDFFKSLPEAAAFGRASGAGSFQRERQQIMADFGPILRECFRSPRQGWTGLSYWFQRLRYLRHGSYEDEKNLLLYYRDRELQLRQAVQAQTWSEMRQLPDATNTTPFLSKGFSGTQAMLNTRQLMLSVQMYSAGGPGRTVIARAAEAEARRRLIITAIALERFYKRDGNYPKSLAGLSPELLKTPPVDFMDGQPLRYRLTDDGHFVLYSVGLDCTDNNGEIQRSPRNETVGDRPRGPGSRRRETDLVWPRPASAAEVETRRREQIRAFAAQITRDEEQQADLQWSWTADRQAQMAKTPVKSATTTAEPTYRGRPLVKTLGNRDVLGTNTLKLAALLTLKQIVTGAEPETITFDVPIVYDVLTNFGQLALLVDPVLDRDSDENCQAGLLECQRATNGNCLLVWNTIYESPGPHALQLGLSWSEPAKDDESFATGPLAPFAVSNLCQFSLSSAYFKPELGPTLRAKLPEPNATYSLEVTSPDGELLKTLTGSTSNGLMTIHWDLVDDRGKRCTNSSFNTIVHLKLQDSGKSQTLKGP